MRTLVLKNFRLYNIPKKCIGINSNWARVYSSPGGSVVKILISVNSLVAMKPYLNTNNSFSLYYITNVYSNDYVSYIPTYIPMIVIVLLYVFSTGVKVGFVSIW